MESGVHTVKRTDGPARLQERSGIFERVLDHGAGSGGRGKRHGCALHTTLGKVFELLECGRRTKSIRTLGESFGDPP